MMTTNGKKPVIFCDFDGTITESDNIVAIMQHFNPPGCTEIIDEIVTKKISIREGVGRMFALLPSSMREEITQFVLAGAKIRPGFSDLLQFCKEHGILFFVTSGGIDFFVYPILAPFPIEEDHIFCNGSDFSGERIRILWPHPCDKACDNDCGMCKTRIIRSYSPNEYYRILIGDSITDFAGAKLADRVFARSHLIAQCEADNIPFTPFETFFNVVESLQKELQPK